MSATKHSPLRQLAGVALALAASGLAAAGCEGETRGGSVDVMLRVLQAKSPSPANAPHAVKGGLVNAHGGKIGGQTATVVDVLIEGSPNAIPKLTKLGVKIRTITSAGIMTASLPLSRLDDAAAVDGVIRISAAKRVKLYNNEANEPGNMNHPAYDPSAGGGLGAVTGGGAGVIVGVIDSGLDWTHPDFQDGSGQSRIQFYWDQSDLADTGTTNFDYGREYDKADFDAYLAGNTGAVGNSAKDTDGHGTHVTGTAAGNGLASGGTYTGAAPDADIVFVKFDFDGARNSTAAIIDAVDYIFKKAEILGQPAVINMSLGSDYGPADGTTLEERGLDALTGPGKVVVVAAGNPGANNASEQLTWGFALHGSGTVEKSDGSTTMDTIGFRYPSGLIDRGQDPDYAFLDIWHDAGLCTVEVRFNGTLACSRSTENEPGLVSSCFQPTLGGSILIGQSSDVIELESNSGDQEVYVELPPATGNWTIHLLDCSHANYDGADPTEAAARDAASSGVYHAKYGASPHVAARWAAEPLPRSLTPTFGGAPSDNAFTIGSPASANEVIAVAAYQTRNSWSYGNGVDHDPATTAPGCVAGTQSYGQYPVDYYDDFAIGELAYFSARGPRRDGVLKPDIAAPGVGIVSAFSGHAKTIETTCNDYWEGGSYHYGSNRVLPGELYTVLQGTSMACPNATGAIARLLSRRPDLDAAKLRDLFAATAQADALVTNYAYTNDGASGHSDTDSAGGVPNNDWGHGKLDISEALSVLRACAETCYPGECASGERCVPGASLSDCASCQACGAEDCANGGDDDCDGLNDNVDPDCN